MKTILSSFFIFLFILSSSAQTYSYHPFPKQKGYWKYAERDWQWQLTGQWINEEYTANGDTLYSPGEGAYYEKDKRIYYRLDTSAVFKVLYDFNLTLGDTFVNPFYIPNMVWVDSMAIVTQEDSTGLGYYGRRTLYLNGQHWIEGIGNPSYHGIKHNIHPGTLSGGWEFKCQYADGQSIPCADAYILGSEEFDLNRIKSFPNPVKDKLILNDLDPNAIVRLFNSSGQGIPIGELRSSNQIDCSNLSTGLYILSIEIHSETRFLKFLKN
jgi:hypothetical protein